MQISHSLEILERAGERGEGFEMLDGRRGRRREREIRGRYGYTIIGFEISTSQPVEPSTL